MDLSEVLGAHPAYAPFPPSVVVTCKSFGRFGIGSRLYVLWLLTFSVLFPA
eukprot:m.74503 g.74503  ORF g.74503 m.74503 type:complete len:51 (-) comp13944_c1_seq4:1959-2111(-)